MDRAPSGDLIYCDPPYTHTQTILHGTRDFRLRHLLEVIPRSAQKARGRCRHKHRWNEAVGRNAVRSPNTGRGYPSAWALYAEAVSDGRLELGDRGCCGPVIADRLREGSRLNWHWSRTLFAAHAQRGPLFDDLFIFLTIFLFALYLEWNGGTPDHGSHRLSGGRGAG